jgi:ribosomal protein S18 acetylase RimI-like enzyme
MMVDADRHREGIGSRLLTHTEAVLAKRGVVRARLETFDGNEQAIRFYRKHGWSETGRAPDAEHGFTRVFFEKHLVARG